MTTRNDMPVFAVGDRITVTSAIPIQLYGPGLTGPFLLNGRHGTVTTLPDDSRWPHRHEVRIDGTGSAWIEADEMKHHTDTASDGTLPDLAEPPASAGKRREDLADIRRHLLSAARVLVDAAEATDRTDDPKGWVRYHLREIDVQIGKARAKLGQRDAS